MLRWFLLLFVVVPLGELYLLVGLSRIIGFWETVAITLLTGMLGASLARREGKRVWRNWNQSLSAGSPPADGIVDGMLVLVGGAFLVTPGVVTDAVGLSLLLPVSRRPVARWVRRLVQGHLARQVLSVAPLGATGGPREPPGPPSSAYGSAASVRRGPPRDEVIDTTGVEKSDA